MQRNANVVGPNVAKFRCQGSWTQTEYVARLQLFGCKIKRQILASGEVGRDAMTGPDYLFVVFPGMSETELFPPNCMNKEETK